MDYVVFDNEFSANTIADIWYECLESGYPFTPSADGGAHANTTTPPTGMMATLPPTSNAVNSINKVYADKLKNNMLPLELSLGQHPRDASESESGWNSPCSLDEDGINGNGDKVNCYLLDEWDKIGQFKNPKEKVTIPCQASLNHFQPREMPYFHMDGDCNTLLYFVGPYFNYDECGESKLIVNKEVVTILPRPGRILIFNCHLHHTAVSYRSWARYTIALKYYWF